jgi:flagellar basal body rod protein FlgG
MPRATQWIAAVLAVPILFACATSFHRPANSPPVIQGGLYRTGRVLDVAIQGFGFFPVTLPNEQIGYTRAGKFFVDDSGKLIVRAGRDYPLSPQLHIPAGATNVIISQDGVVGCNFAGQTTTAALGQLRLALFSNPAALTPINADPVFIARKNSGSAVITNPGDAGAGQIMQTYLEGVYHGPWSVESCLQKMKAFLAEHAKLKLASLTETPPPDAAHTALPVA